MKKNAYLENVKKCQTIDELTWVQVDASQDGTLAWADLVEVLRAIDNAKRERKAAGDVYHRATRPAFAK